MGKRYKLKTQYYLTQKEIENGIWQFLIDHAVPYEKNLWQVKYLRISSKDEVMSRIYARATGLYKIKDEAKIQKEMENKIKYFQSLAIGARKAKNKEQLFMNLRDECRWKFNVILFLRKFANKLLLRWTIKNTTCNYSGDSL